MLFFFGIIAAIGGVAAMAFGVVVVYRGYFNDQQADVDLDGYKVKVPVGIAVFASGLAALVVLVWVYSKGVEAENARVTTERDQYKIGRDAIKTDRDAKESHLKQAQTEARNEKARADRLASRLAAETAERQQAQDFARDAWLANDWQALSPDQRAQLDQYTRGVLALNNDLAVLRIRIARWPTLSGRKAIATFEIHRKDFDADATRPRGAGLFQFRRELFTLEGESTRGLTEELAAGIARMICDAASAAIVNHVSPRDAFARIPSLAKYDGDAQRILEVAEFQYVRMRLQLLAADSLVLVRGYADGEEGPWERPLEQSFKDIQVHENANPNSKPVDYSLEFRPELARVTLGRPSTNYAKYGNEDLPNLRGEAAARLVSALLKSCSPPAGVSLGKIAVEILDGRVYEGKSEPDRKARVHLLVFLKD